ncbi:uncharacterized protein LOC133125301 isoform X2 [Conger conger]|uniref:uncharacterized protein LOC133125301 isoform X2 n=1 Tax=Conger conger TaxID=82655 RepID=UPI002A5A3CED|nr:uncharacterized protein LOC133125301 isoform X2 [Conger conger]
MGWRYYFLYYFIWIAQDVLSERIILKKFLGESVIFPLRTELKKNSDVTLKKNGDYIFRWDRNDVDPRYVDRLAFNENRTLSLDKLEETDAGPYLLEQFDTAGIAHKTEITIILTCLKGFHEVHGDLGGSVAVFGRNLTGLSMISEARWEKNGLVVAQLNQSRPVYSEKPEGRLRMLPTGECWLDRVHSEDAGNYTLEVSKGDLRLRWTAQLVFRVPRPSVEHRCLLDGTAEFHCLVNPGVRTRWILHGNPLGLGVPENKKMVLHFFSGELLCVLEEYPERRVSVSFTCAGRSCVSVSFTCAGKSCVSVLFTCTGRSCVSVSFTCAGKSCVSVSFTHAGKSCVHVSCPLLVYLRLESRVKYITVILSAAFIQSDLQLIRLGRAHSPTGAMWG